MTQIRCSDHPVFEHAHASQNPIPDPDSIKHFLDFCHRRRYPAKHRLIQPCDPAKTLYYVISGSLTIYTEDEQGRELIMAYLGHGQFVGEIGLFAQHNECEAVVRSRTSCEIAEISYERLFQLMEGPLREHCPKILCAIGLQLTQRLQHTSNQLRRMVFMDVLSRVTDTLHDLCHEPEAMTHPDGIQIRISRQEMSRIVGCSREMVGRSLKQLVAKRMIDVTGKNIVVRTSSTAPST